MFRMLEARAFRMAGTVEAPVIPAIATERVAASPQKPPAIQSGNFPVDLVLPPRPRRLER